MKIYDFEGFPNPARVRIALAEKGVMDQITFISINVPEGEHRKPEFMAKNPGATVPVLELNDGTTISECTAITEYIDHAFDGVSLTGTSAKERALVHMMQRRAEQSVMDAVAGFFHHATPGLGPDIETYQNKDWGLKQKERAIAGMKYFDSVLADSPYVAGGNFSMADITLFAGLAFADFIKLEISNDLKNLIAWREKMTQRSSMAG